ncbi:DEAD/DEAH box helicase [Rothia sp. ZJ1223]|uniref:DEAD/DEAH box helicase n=1 Tax=Rothia sp. ZJ1223 TaxID=2811098 RepID=UPI00195C982D|nr:DEAD/DEAH box helicase [Rothia sp. ZJ1223]MBM7050932.1 DEAD/DEAH box helicase [Rothia sp. ZJ1223]
MLDAPDTEALFTIPDPEGPASSRPARAKRPDKGKAASSQKKRTATARTPRTAKTTDGTQQTAPATSASTPEKKAPVKKTRSQKTSPRTPASDNTRQQVQKIKAQYSSEKRLENEPLTTYLHHTTAKSISTHIGCKTVGELLEYYPRKYLPRGELTSFAQLIEGQDVTLLAKVLSVSTRSMQSRRGSITEIVITDQLTDDDTTASTGGFGVQGGRSTFTPGGGATNPRVTGSASGYSDTYGVPNDAFFDFPPTHAPLGHWGTGNFTRNQSQMTLSFFNAWTAAREIHRGDHVMFSGKVGTYRGELTLTNPHFAVLTGDEVPERASAEAIERAKHRATAPIPVYKAPAKLPTDRIAAAIEQVLDKAPLRELEDPVPASIRRARKIPSLAWTYRALHTPDTEETWRSAHYSLRYREAFILQIALARTRAARKAHQTVARPALEQGYAQKLLELLPYELTVGQQKVGSQIASDLASEIPMNRLLQGDVGSGKTVVALRAMLQVADNGGQAAMLAPTEVLAEQHYYSILDILGQLATSKPGTAGVRVVLLKASMPAKIKKQTLLEMASGQAHIVIGTHALLADAVQFADLGMVVVDEQHRFGVEQRDALRGADGALPHRLVMTATPIPRTVAMTVFGDLDTSVLDQLPAGRQKITTHVVPLAEKPTWRERLWQRAREEVDAGHQVYIVVPKIGAGTADEMGSDGTGQTLLGADAQEKLREPLTSVASMLDELSTVPALCGVRIEGLHGRMDTAVKSDVMRRFGAGEVDVLVSTTVIEVGVNVPNATLMVIMDADRFGISGLHQLRGRIGRGSLAGTCLLVTKQPADGVSRERLAALAASTDGFELSKIDLEQRREGDILGAAQSGKKSTLKLLRALTDAPLIEKAREDAQGLVDVDPTLAGYPDIVRTLERALDDDAEAFLGRG